MTGTRRLYAICNAYLVWQYEHNARQPNPDAFLTLGAETPDGVSITPDELESCTEYLVAVGLIEGRKAFGRPMPLRVKLTQDGIRCVLEFDGDVEAWNRRHLQHVDQSVHVHSQGDAQVVAHSHHVSQMQQEALKPRPE